jgi:hypothetical protein
MFEYSWGPRLEHVLGNALWTVRRVLRQTDQLPEDLQMTFQWTACGIGASVAAYATYGLTGHLLYLEAMWWYLMMPVCLERAFENAREEVPCHLFDVETQSPSTVAAGA